MPKKILFLFIFIFSFLKMEAQYWSLMWSDEFSVDTINTGNWNFETGGGGWGNNELQYYTNRSENIRATNGNLQIIARQESYNGNNYTSARITTKGKQFIRYGKVEARVKLPEQKGLWPAFWMLGENITQVGWPQCGEIDILEHVNREANIHGTIHWDNNGHAQYGTGTACDVSQFHVYGIEWDSTTIKWFLDSTEYWSANIANNINSTDEFHLPFFAILNMAVGGTWPGSPDGTSIFPDTMFVDYVRFYKQDTLPTIHVATTPTITVNGTLTICAGDSVILSSSLATNYLWSTADTSQSIVVKTGGVYTVEITDSLGGKATSDTVTVVVNVLPAKPLISINGNVLSSSAVTNNQWLQEGVVLEGAVGPIFTALLPGKYAVRVTNADSCSVTSDAVLISLTGIYDLNFSNSIRIIPNPGAGVFSVGTNGEPILKIEIYNLWGKIIFETQDPTEKINISAQEKGVYLLSVQLKNRTVFEKVFVQ